jgi:hypothetical protein
MSGQVIVVTLRLTLREVRYHWFLASLLALITTTLDLWSWPLLHSFPLQPWDLDTDTFGESAYRECSFDSHTIACVTTVFLIELLRFISKELKSDYQPVQSYMRELTGRRLTDSKPSKNLMSNQISIGLGNVVRASSFLRLVYLLEKALSMASKLCLLYEAVLLYSMHILLHME